MKLPQEKRDIFTDAYKFYEDNWDMPDNAERWAECAEQIGPLVRKHGNAPLIRNLLMALYETIDEENRAAREALKCL